MKYKSVGGMVRGLAKKKPVNKSVRGAVSKDRTGGGKAARKASSYKTLSTGVRDSVRGRVTDKPKARSGLRKRARRALKAGSSFSSVRKRVRGIQRGR